MKRSLIALALLSCTVAQAQQQMDTEARVVDVQPRMSQSTQYRQECTQVHNQPQQQQSYTGGVIGGVAGALLGNTVGQGRGRQAATAAGAILGSMTGDRMQNSNSGGGQQCRDVPVQSQRQEGYDVTIEYNGQQQRVFMMNRPGRVVRVRISMSVLDSPSYDNDGYRQSNDGYRQSNNDGYRQSNDGYRQSSSQQYQNGNWR